MNQKLIKAYKNSEFLNSPAARTLRILAEFLEPNARLRRKGIRDTVVFFGSARTLPRIDAAKNLRKIRASLKGKKKLTAKQSESLRRAEVDLEMSAYYEDCVKLAFLLTRWSRTLKGGKHFAVCSGGGPGIMEAANRGAMKAGGPSIGLNISLPFEQGANPYISKDLVFEFHYFFMRKFWFMYPAKGLVMFPGGYGTLDELVEALTLVQTKKISKPLPIVLYGRSYWERILNIKELVRLGMISPSDTKLFTYADSPEEAFEYIKKKLTRHYLKH